MNKKNLKNAVSYTHLLNRTEQVFVCIRSRVLWSVFLCHWRCPLVWTKHLVINMKNLDHRKIVAILFQNVDIAFKTVWDSLFSLILIKMNHNFRRMYLQARKSDQWWIEDGIRILFKTTVEMGSSMFGHLLHHSREWSRAIVRGEDPDRSIWDKINVYDLGSI